MISRVILILCALISAGMLILAVSGAMKKGHRERVELKPKAHIAALPDISQSGINLNTAAKEELMALPGIGEHLAEQLILKREEQPFYFVEDVSTVKGFGDKRIAVLKQHAYVPLPQDPENPGASSDLK